MKIHVQSFTICTGHESQRAQMKFTTVLKDVTCGNCRRRVLRYRDIRSYYRLKLRALWNL